MAARPGRGGAVRIPSAESRSSPQWYRRSYAGSESSAPASSPVPPTTRAVSQPTPRLSGDLHVGFGMLTAETLAGPCIGRFLREHPRIRLRVALLATDEMAEAIVSGRVDVLVGEPLAARGESL